jgi:hypothetical protein
MNKLSLATIAALVLAILLSTNACKKEEAAKGIDRELYEMSLETDGFIWYKNSDVLLPKSSITGHGEILLRTRYNSIAAQDLDANGKVKDNTVFSEGALIVKELYNNANDFSTYAVMYKKTKTPRC